MTMHAAVAVAARMGSHTSGRVTVELGGVTSGEVVIPTARPEVGRVVEEVVGHAGVHRVDMVGGGGPRLAALDPTAVLVPGDDRQPERLPATVVVAGIVGDPGRLLDRHQRPAGGTRRTVAPLPGHYASSSSSSSPGSSERTHHQH